MTRLILIRGLPGSGKSTLAKQLVSINHGSNIPSIHLESDMYHVLRGEYIFEGGLVPAAHKWCVNTTEVFLNNGYDVVVSNTFTRKWEIAPYKKLSDLIGCPFEIVTCTGNYGNVHNVPEEVIQKMKDRWETWE